MNTSLSDRFQFFAGGLIVLPFMTGLIAPIPWLVIALLDLVPMTWSSFLYTWLVITGVFYVALLATVLMGRERTTDGQVAATSDGERPAAGRDS